MKIVQPNFCHSQKNGNQYNILKNNLDYLVVAPGSPFSKNVSIWKKFSHFVSDFFSVQGYVTKPATRLL